MLLAYNFVSLSGMGWNLLLAFIPLVLASGLFRHGRRLGMFGWVGVAVFILFLPNAAYVLTDVIQLVRRVRQQPYLPVWTIALVLVPQYAAFMIAGFEAHVISLCRVGSYLRSLGRGRWVVPAELALNFAVAIGLYLGRYRRFNSWDILRDPLRLSAQTAEDFTNAMPWYVVFVAFGVVVLLYYLVKFLNSAVLRAAASSLSHSDNGGQPLGRLSTTTR
jgi:uncharacterized membrane protein